MIETALPISASTPSVVRLSKSTSASRSARLASCIAISPSGAPFGSSPSHPGRSLMRCVVVQPPNPPHPLAGSCHHSIAFAAVVATRNNPKIVSILVILSGLSRFLPPLRLCVDALRSHALAGRNPMLRWGFYYLRNEFLEPRPRIGNEFDFSMSLRAFCHVRTFEASKLKLERAAEHLREFDGAASAYINDGLAPSFVEYTTPPERGRDRVGVSRSHRTNHVEC